MTGLDWDASAYLQYYDWDMQSNPTYDFQINQFDKRMTTGGRYDLTLIEEMSLEFDVGAEFRYDDIGPVGLDEYEDGVFIANISKRWNAIGRIPFGEEWIVVNHGNDLFHDKFIRGV